MTKKKTKTVEATKKSPLQIVKERYGEKKKLISELAGRIERRDGESKGNFEKRLSKVSCAKLLNLLDRADEVEKAGGRATLMEFIQTDAARRQAKKSDPKLDESYKAHLDKKTTGTLLDSYRVVQKHKRAQKQA